MKINQIVSGPSRFFKNPEKLVQSDGLNEDQKIRALENWKDSLIQISTSEQKGMDSRMKRVEIVEVDRALRQIKRRT